MSEPSKLRVFLCHSSADKPIVRELYEKLATLEWIDPWLDVEKLLPGQAWNLEIEKAVEAADAVIVCLSHNSVTKEGYVQKEFRKIIEVALEKPEETIFVIPLRLDNCELPRQLRARHAVDYFPPENRPQTIQRLLRSLEIRFSQLAPSKDHAQTASNAAKILIPVQGEAKPQEKNWNKRLAESLTSKGTGAVDVTGSIPLVLYFFLTALYLLTSSDSTNQFVAGIFGVLASIPLVLKRQIPATIFFKILVIVYLGLHGANSILHMGWGDTAEGITAFILCGVCVLTIRSPKKPLFYSSIALALFLFTAGAKEMMAAFDFYLPFIYAPITIINFAAVILLLGDL